MYTIVLSAQPCLVCVRIYLRTTRSHILSEAALHCSLPADLTKAEQGT